MLDLPDTVFAVASGGAQAALTVVRVSGPSAGAVLDRLCRRPLPRQASLRRLRHRGEVLDQAMVLWFPAPRSYTGEDCVELHLHGGRGVLQGITSALVSNGCRPADRGEFTRRAVINGRMELVRAEAVSTLVAAETANQRRAALRALDGHEGATYRSWTRRLTGVLARLEGQIDFPDDLVEQSDPDLDLLALRDELFQAWMIGQNVKRLQAGLTFAIVGPPNSGKSSLFNALAQRDMAIVASSAGTTRDVLEARLDFDGVPVTLLDTAGLRTSTDDVEAEGIRRARDRAGIADVVIAVHESGDNPMLEPFGGTRIDVTTKIDRGGIWTGIGVSAVTGAGLDAFRARLCREACDLTEIGEGEAITNARHHVAIGRALTELRSACDADLLDLRAEHARTALVELGRITGAVDREAVLDVIFSTFCIGK